MQSRHKKEGVDAYTSGKHKQAILHFNNAIEETPDDADLFYYRGVSYFFLQCEKEAFIDWQKAIALNPNHTQVYCYQALADSRLGYLDKAIEGYSKALEINPEYIPAYYQRALLYQKLSNYAKAINDYTHIIELEKPSLRKYPGKLELAYLNRANSYLALQKYDEAILDYSNSIALDGSLADCYWGRFQAYHRQGNLHEAISDCIQAFSLNPNKVEYYNCINSISRKMIFSIISTFPNEKQIVFIKKCLDKEEPLGRLFSDDGLVKLRKKMQETLYKIPGGPSAFKRFRVIGVENNMVANNPEPSIIASIENMKIIR